MIKTFRAFFVALSAVLWIACSDAPTDPASFREFGSGRPRLQATQGKERIRLRRALDQGGHVLA
jgi:hypothetical protein